jgi:D-alanyl-D-alanine carboxypeptidase (penicillin-binding protein 5/6)
MLRLAAFLLLAGSALSGSAQSLLPIPPVPPIAAKSWLLLDYQSQQLIASGSAEQRADPAALTKLMTAYVAFDAIRQKRITLAQPLPVSAKAAKMPGARMFLVPDRPATVDELLRGLIVQAANDAAIALAEGIAGSEEAFVQEMNARAQQHGMAGTRFANATGLPDPGHYSTAADLARLASTVLREFPEFLPLFGLRDLTYNGITQPNRNLLLGRDPHVDGFAAGHSDSAGYCMIATARREHRRLIALVLGAASESARAIEAQKLLNYGFQYYDTVRLYEKGAAVAVLPVWKGSEETLKAGFDYDLFVAVPRGQSSLLKASLETKQPIVAPVSRQQPVGVLKLTFDGEPVAEYPVVALESVAVANLFGRAWDTLRLLFK